VHHCISSSEVRGGSREELRTPGSWGKGNSDQTKTAWRRSEGRSETEQEKNPKCILEELNEPERD